MTLRRRHLQIAAAGTIGFLTITGIGLRALTPDLERRHHEVARIQELRELDARLKEGVLASRYGLLASYDPLVALMRRMRTVAGDIAGDERSAGGHQGAASRRLVRLLARQGRLLEEFKSANAVLRNSSSYFPRAATDLSISLVVRKDGQSLRVLLEQLTSLVLTTVVMGDRINPAWVVDTMAQVADGDREIARVLAHARTIFAVQPRLDRIVRHLVQIRSGAVFGHLLAIQTRSDDLAVRRSNVYGTLMYLASLALLVGVAFVVLRLQGKAEELQQGVATLEAQRLELDRHRGDLEKLNHELDLRVLERTEQVVQGVEALERSQAEVEAILESMPSFLVSVDDAGLVTHWNRAAEALFGTARTAVMGRLWTECGIQWDWERVPGQMAEAVPGGPGRTLRDIPATRGDGTPAVLSVAFGALQLPDRTGGFVIVGDDVSERRMLETQLQETQRLESVGRLASGIAHEINTPIQFVGDNARFLRSAFDELQTVLQAYQQLRDAAAAAGVAPELLAEVAQAEAAADLEYLKTETGVAVEQTLDGVDRVATLVRAMKDFAHPDQKDKVAASLNQALASTLAVARNEIKYVADVTTEFGDLPEIPCHVSELNQVFLNLLVNAAHAIAATGQRGNIHVRTSTDPDGVLISIADTGGGIPDEIRARIFDPFFTTKPLGQGTGQGLAIARSVVVDKHGGTLALETTPGKGTTFFIHLPLTEAHTAATSAAA